jgi:GAF domain-containing protein
VATGEDGQAVAPSAGAAIGGYLALATLKPGVSAMPMSAKEVRQALRELDELRYAAGNLDDALRRIVDATHQLFAVDGAGLMLIDPDQLLRNVADSDRRVDDLEELQIDHGEGPCIDAFDDKELVHAADLGAEKRWPKFSPAAVDRGLRAVLASPIPYNQMAIGVVTVFSTKVHPWSPEGELALIAFTDLAALTIANTMQSEQRGELAEQLQRALDARVVIEQAKGALVAQEGLSEREAFERMRRQARRQRRRVVEVAAEVMADIRHP